MMERPDERVDEKVFERVVKTFGERTGKLAHGEAEVFCYADAFHPSSIQGKHKACMENGHVLQLRVSFDMGREEVRIRALNRTAQPKGDWQSRTLDKCSLQKWSSSISSDLIMRIPLPKSMSECARRNAMGRMQRSESQNSLIPSTERSVWSME
jgi:hypothetical protein